MKLIVRGGSQEGRYNNSMKETIKITLELPISSVRLIERLAECDIKQLLELEMSECNVDCFAEKMDYDNW